MTNTALFSWSFEIEHLFHWLERSTFVWTRTLQDLITFVVCFSHKNLGRLRIGAFMAEHDH